MRWLAYVVGSTVYGLVVVMLAILIGFIIFPSLVGISLKVATQREYTGMVHVTFLTYFLCLMPLWRPMMRRMGESDIDTRQMLTFAIWFFGTWYFCWGLPIQIVILVAVWSAARLMYWGIAHTLTQGPA